MKLLAPTPPAELPAETLLARLRYRRAAINLAAGQEGKPPSTDISSWVYKRLNHQLRKRLGPFLDLHAMRGLSFSLRHSLAGETPPAEILHNSLLAEPLQRLVTKKADAEATIAQLEATLGNDYPFVNGLTSTYRRQGPGGVEQQLVEGILLHSLTRSKADLLKMTLRYLIDMRNCLMINKLWRWQVSQPPNLTSGGTFAIARLKRIWAAHDGNSLSLLTDRLAGEPSPAAATGVEQSLLKGLTRLLRRAGRDPLGLAVVIEYLWVTQLAVHNHLLRQALPPDRRDLLEEVLLL